MEIDKIKGKSFFDDDGNEINGDEVAELLATKEKALQDLEEKLKNVEQDSKLVNFKKLKEMSEEERAKFSAKELKDMEEKQALQEQINMIKTERYNDWRDSAMGKYSDEERAIIEKNMDMIKDTDEVNLNTKEGLVKKVEMAAKISGVQYRDPMSSVNFMSGRPMDTKKTITVSSALKELGDEIGLTEEDFKKADNLKKSN